MPDPLVQVEDLAVRFGGHTALEDVAFAVTPGDYLAVIGPNGSGKTTLLRVLLGLIAPTRGSVSVHARPARVTDPHTLGYVPQIKTLDRSFPARSIELVATGVRARWPIRLDAEGREEALDALDRVGGRALADRPLGDLSGGELQRVYLARSLVREPELLLLDEPGTGVDAGGVADLYDLLESYQAEHGTAVLMVTHDLSVAYHHASHVLVLDRRQIAFGPPEEALTDRALREAFGHVGHSHVMRARRNDP